MEQLLKTFRDPVADKDGNHYRVYLYGLSRPADTWAGWLVFERLPNGERFATGIETTQSNADGIVYWATGLTDAYFAGAIERALHPVKRDNTPIPARAPVVNAFDDTSTRRMRLNAVENAVFSCFQTRHTTRLPARRVFDTLDYANADIVRALEDLEKQRGLVVRRTEDGNDWLFLTEAGVGFARLGDVKRSDENVERDLPRSH